MSSPSFNALEQIQALKLRSVNRLIKGVFLLAVIAVPLSVSRATYTGWQHSYTIHIVALIILGAMYFIPEKLPPLFRISVLLFLSISVAVSGILEYGTIGNATLWSMFSMMIALFFIGRKTAFIVGMLLLTVFLLAMYRFVFMDYPFPGGIETYLVSPASWGTTLFGAVIFIALIAISVAEQRQELDSLLVTLVEQNQTIDEQKKQIEFQANHDALTGLPTLRLADDRLDMAMKLAKREGAQTALLFLDLDGFKSINDTYGHACGDQVLKLCAERILSEVRESDTACRVGGDEFLIVLNHVESDDDLAHLCERLVLALSQPVTHSNNKIGVSVSLGAAIYPDHASDAENLRRQADEAMYQAKKAGKNRYQIVGC